MFLDTDFPRDINIGLVGGPRWRTDIVTLPSGAEQRLVRQARGRRRWMASYSTRTPAQMAALLDLFEVAQGRTHSFRMRDPNCYSTGTPYRGQYSKDDVTLMTGDGVTDTCQMLRKHTVAGQTRYYPVRHIESGTATIAYDGVLQSSGWSIDAATGEITFTTPPGLGVVVTGGCQFSFEARFDTDQLDVEMLAVTAQAVRSIPLVEIVDTALVDLPLPATGAVQVTTGANLLIDIAKAGLWLVTPSGSGLEARLPDATLYPTGQDLVTVHVPSSASHSLAVVDHAGDAVDDSAGDPLEIAPGDSAHLCLLDNATAAGVWLAIAAVAP